ncbi:MAG: PKD domain-containing protein [Methanomicrobiales archaeon]
MKMYEKIKSVRKIKRSLLIVLVLLLAIVGYATALPVANFSSVPTQGIVPLSVQFTDTSIGNGVTINNWTWDFKDHSAVENVPNPSHIFNTAGQYPVSLVVSDGTSMNISVPTVHFVNVSPLAQFTGTPISGFAPLTVQFTDTTLGFPDGWNWLFGDGNLSTAQSPSYIYSRSGVYTVNLTAYKNDLSNKSTNMAITVNPLADFTINPSPGNVSSTFQLNGTSTGTPVVNYTWSFGDGTSSISVITGSTNNITHSYTVANTYYPTLTVYGQSGTSSGVITKSLPVYPVAKFTATPNNPIVGRPVQFTDASLGDIANQSSGPGSWLWEFGDGTTSTLQNPTHIYQPGKYTAKLTVTKNSLSNFITTIINVDSGNLYLLRSGINGNTYYFKANKYGIYLPQNSIKFIAYPTRSMSKFLSNQQSIGTTYEWKFWGANTGEYLTSGIKTVPEYTQTFTKADIYTVQLNVTDSRDTYTVTKPRLVVVRGGGS